MFTTTKKRRYRTYIVSAIIILLCALIVVIAWPAPKSDAADINANADTKTDSLPDGSGLLTDENDDGENDDGENDENDGEYDEEFDENYRNEAENDKNSENNGGINQKSETYYVVKRADDAIKVFFMNSDGNLVELETTNIVYDVLSVEDQQLFNKGMVVRTQEELAVLLQDFES